MNEFVEHNFLCHHGILGMKWGIRRYQNPDGSLTSEGRLRYGGEKAEAYRQKLVKMNENRSNSILRSKNKRIEYAKRAEALRNASNDEIAKILINKKKSQKGGAALGLAAGALFESTSSRPSALRLLTHPHYKKGGTTIYDKDGKIISTTGKVDIEQVAIPLVLKFNNFVVTPMSYGYGYGKKGEEKATQKLVAKYYNMPYYDINKLIKQR